MDWLSVIRLSAAATLLAAVVCTSASAQVTLTADFENGWMNGVTQAGDTWTVNSNLGTSSWEWLHFRADGVLGQTPQFRTPEAAQDVYRDYHRMVYSYDGMNWDHLDTGSRPGDGYYYFSNSTSFTQDSVYLAYWQPYTFTQAQNYFDTVKNHQYVRTAYPLQQQTYEGRDLLRFQITDPDSPDNRKNQVIIVARQHGYESLGNYVTEGLVDFLLSDDPIAQSVREKAIVTVYPMANPDAVVHGWTREGYSKTGGRSDFNRDWLDGAPSTGGTPSDSYEVDALRDDIVAITGGDAAIMIDAHSHARSGSGDKYYWWFRGDSEQEAKDFFQAVREADGLYDGGYNEANTLFEWPTIRYSSNLQVASGWGNTVLGGMGFTLEPIAGPYGQMRTTDRIREAGEAIGIAFDSALELLDPGSDPPPPPPPPGGAGDLITNGTFDDTTLTQITSSMDPNAMPKDEWMNGGSASTWTIHNGYAEKTSATSGNLVQQINMPDPGTYYLAFDYIGTSNHYARLIGAGGVNWWSLQHNGLGDNEVWYSTDVPLPSAAEWTHYEMEFEITQEMIDALGASGDPDSLFVFFRQYSASGFMVDNVQLYAPSELLAGDANGDGQVDGNDLIAVEENFGATGDPGIPGDANGDGQVDGNDLISVEENFGSTSAANVAVTFQQVPEPASVLLLGSLVAMWRRRR